MAEVNTGATTTPQTTKKIELWYATTASGSKTQIFMVQTIPQLSAPAEPVTYSCLESASEFQAKGIRKAESLTIPLLYVEAQHTALKTIADAGTKLYFTVKLPDDTSATSSPKAFTFSGTIDITLDEVSTGDNMIQETLTIYKDSTVTEGTWSE